jgi:GH18 family chitinase
VADSRVRPSGCNIVSTADSANFLLLLKELRAKLGSSALLTAAVSMTGFIGPDGNPLTDFSAFAKYLDYILIMAVSASVIVGEACAERPFVTV